MSIPKNTKGRSESWNDPIEHPYETNRLLDIHLSGLYCSDTRLLDGNVTQTVVLHYTNKNGINLS